MEANPSWDEEPLYNGAVFYVEDPAQLESVMEQVQAMDIVDWDYFTVERKDDDYQTSAGPIQTMADLSGGLVFIVGFRLPCDSVDPERHVDSRTQARDWDSAVCGRYRKNDPAAIAAGMRAGRAGRLP